MKKLILSLCVIVNCGFVNAEMTQLAIRVLEKTISQLRKEILPRLFNGDFKDEAEIERTVNDQYFQPLAKNRAFLRSIKHFSNSIPFPYKGLTTSFFNEIQCFQKIFRVSKAYNLKTPEHILYSCMHVCEGKNLAVLLLQEGVWYETSETLLHIALHLVSDYKKTEETALPMISIILENRMKYYGKNTAGFKAFLNKQYDGETALMLATREGHINIVKKLLEAGADLNTSTETGVSALSFAFLHNFTNIASLLVSKGAEIDKEITDRDFLDKLKETVPTTETETLDFTRKISLWRLAIHLPSKQNFIEIFLPYAKDRKTETYPILFHRAIHEGNTELATLLVENDFETTQIKELPEDTDFEKAKEPIMVFLASGMPLEGVPCEHLDENMIWPFIRRCVADPNSTLANPTSSFTKNKKSKKTIEKFMKKMPLSLPASYREKVLDFCTRSTSSDIETTPVVCIPIPKTPEERVFASGNTALVLVSTPSLGETTTARNKEQNLRAKGRKQSEEPKAEVVLERTSSEPIIKIFSSTPRIPSKRLNKKELEDLITNHVTPLINFLTLENLIFSLEKEEHYELKTRNVPDWARERYQRLQTPNSITIPHGGQKSCTDYINEMPSYLTYFMAELALSSESSSSTATDRLQELINLEHIDYNELIGLFPQLKSKLDDPSSLSKSPTSSDDDDDDDDEEE